MSVKIIDQSLGKQARLLAGSGTKYVVAFGGSDQGMTEETFVVGSLADARKLAQNESDEGEDVRIYRATMQLVEESRRGKQS